MIDDRNPNFARGFRVSSAQLGGLRRKWGEVGRQAYAEAIRTGRDVLARTEAEIEALGRNKIDEVERKRKDGLAILGVADAVGPLKRNRDDMIEAGWIGADKYFHCKGNCEAAQRGPAAEEAAVRLGNGRELYGTYVKGDPRWDNRADQSANRYGRSQGRADGSGSCSAHCAAYRPAGFPTKY